MKKILLSVLIGGVILATPFAMGMYSNMVDKVVGKQYNDVQREKFKEGTTYVEGKINDLSRYKREYEKANESDKQAIAINIKDEFSNFDYNKIENRNLKQFLLDILNNNL